MHLFCVCFPARQHPEEMEAMGAGAEEPQNHTAMLWSIQEAVQRQTLQIGASACGATAVVDVLQALGITVTPETVDHCVRTSLRRNEAPLDDYLLSRSEAGTVVTYLLTAAVRKFCLFVAISVWKPAIAVICAIIFITFSHLADTFIQSDLQMRTISDQNQQKSNDMQAL